MSFKVAGRITSIETIARGHGIRELRRLNRQYGRANWIKKKGIAVIVADNGVRAKVELHWYDAHGIGKRELKIKAVLSLFD